MSFVANEQNIQHKTTISLAYGWEEIAMQHIIRRGRRLYVIDCCTHTPKSHRSRDRAEKHHRWRIIFFD